jgi:membrane-bound ClpP family serine protease
MAAGGFLAYAGLILLLIAVSVLVGDLLNNYWLSTLLVGLAVVVIGWVMLNSGKSQLNRMNLTPQKTIDTLSADAQMVKEKLT